MKDKNKLEQKIEETIKIIGYTHPDNTVKLEKYQKILSNYVEEWRMEYEIDYKYLKRTNDI